MSGPQHRFKVPFTSEQKARYADYIKALREVQMMEQNLIDEMSTHDSVAFAREISEGRLVRSEKRLTAAGLEVTFAPQDHGHSRSVVPPSSGFFMDPKTMNLLLSGKLISDEQKKAMVAKAYPQLEEIFKEKKDG